MNKHPKITVVTVCYNAASIIEETILSVISQSYKDIEYIIIDGKSTDNTLDIIKKYEPHISTFISESDKGIYDAMNKGLRLATGEWISFINTGDKYYNDHVLEDIFSKPVEQLNIIYGDTEFIRENGRFIEKSFEPKWLERNMPTCHQSFFVRTTLAKNIGFDTRYKYASDYNMIYNIFQDAGINTVQHVPVVVSTYNAREGSSMVFPNAVYKETIDIRKMSINKIYGYIRYYIKKSIGRK